MIVDTERDGWTRVGTLGWRKSLRDKHWAQIVKDPLGWAWTIHKADPVTMCPITVAGSVFDGLDISLAAAKDDVDHWNRNYRRHAIVIGATSRLPQHYDRHWHFECRYCGAKAGLFSSPQQAYRAAALEHGPCEAAWQRGER
jgi:hypothetical protein